MIGAKYCTHSFEDCSAPRREAACTAPHRKLIGLAKLLITGTLDTAPWAG